MNNQLAKQILEQTRNSYNAMADKFSDTRKYQWPVMDDLISRYVKDGDKILDVGCGNGRLFRRLEGLPVSYLGIDNSEKLIESARQSGGQFQVKDMLNLDFKQEFDLVFAVAVINHLSSQEIRLQALKNIYQALKPGGLLVMTNWNLWKLSAKQKTVWRYKIRLEGWKVGRLRLKDVMTIFNNGQGNRYQLYYRAFTLGELKKLVKQAGFEIDEGYYEKRGQKSHWWAADNLVLVCRKR